MSIGRGRRRLLTALRALDRARRGRRSSALCAIARDEAPFLEEWAAFHLAAGFDHIVVYEHRSGDGDGGAERLRQGRWSSRVTVLPWSTTPGEAPQPAAYRDFMRRLAPRFDWVAFLDIDEFLNLKRHGSVADFLAAYPKADALGVNWRMFGSSGRAEAGEGLVIERFTRAAPADFFINRHVKTLARTDRIIEPGVHCPALHAGAVFVAPDGVPRIAGLNVWQDHLTHEAAQVNHYFTKSRAEFDAKVARGRADLAADDPERFRDRSIFEGYDRNEEEDLTIQRWRPALLATLAAMRGG